MTPKGGIRPHKRFSIQANRSEVLFVDYIAEHLSTSGRAGVIVPEGIIFQSANAYKALRKMLIEQNYLWAVVSLPAGVFNPYSGVKTSILFMDKVIAKKTNDILFIKIDHDGFDLGAQRRPNGKDDLPAALDAIRKYKKSLSLHDSINDVNALIVSKSRIAENGDYNLSIDRYRDVHVYLHQTWPFVNLGEVCELFSGGTPSKVDSSFWQNGSIKWISSKHIDEYHQIVGYELINEKAIEKSSTKIAPKDSIILITRVSVGKYAYADQDYAINQDLTAIIPLKSINPKYLYIISKKLAYIIENNSQGVGVRGVTREFVEKLKIPLPSLEIQKEIVFEIESYQKIIDGARQVVENWRPSFSVDPDWPLVELGEVCEVISGQSPEGEFYNDRGEGTPFYQGKTEFSNKYIGSPHKWTTRETKIAEKDDILMSVRAPVGPVNISTQRICIGRGLAAIRASEKILIPFLFALLRNKEKEIKGNGGAVFDSINRKDIESIRIPLPPLEVQHEFVARIEEEQKLVDSNKRLIDIYEAKIKSKIDEVWGS